jgi:hypothetical protein
MRNYRSKTGPFRERPYFTDAEIENICAEALISVNLYPQNPEPIRIERFIERRFNVTPKYEPIEDGVLGLTVFGRDGVKDIIVSSKIDEENSVVGERRIRSTLAYEGGHGLFHTHLFALASSKPLFGDHTDPHKPKVLCRDENDSALGNSYKGQWWEFQANKAIGALLMPKSLVELAVDEFMITSGMMGFKQFDNSKELRATQLLTETFAVNAPVARIRLRELFPIEKMKQPML